MTFKEAKEKLKALANGRYHTIEFSLTEHHDGEIEPRCTLYVADIDSRPSGRTWEEAFIALERGFDGPTLDEALKAAPDYDFDDGNWIHDPDMGDQ